MEKQVSLYIHIPFCISKCDYCDFFSVKFNSNLLQEYVDSLCNEIKFRINQYGKYRIKTVYIGGGTPSILTPAQIIQISNTINADDVEFTFEVNPDDVTLPLIKALEQAGVNRISCGVQSFSQRVLKSIHRRADREQNLQALELLTTEWKKNLSIDLISGLPFETEETLLEGLDILCKKRIPHISLYSLCVEEETPLGKAIINNEIKYDSDFSDELWIKGRDFLLANGYNLYEVSNFCLPGNECKHNMTYWSHGDYIGAGSGATGTVYNQDGTGTRWTNTKNINEYIDFWKNMNSDIPQDQEKIDFKDSQFEYFMMGLRTKRGISTFEYKSIFGKEFPPEIEKKLEEWCELDRCECKINDDGNKNYAFNNEGLLFLNAFLEELF